MKLRLHHLHAVADDMDELHDLYALLGLGNATFFNARGGEDVDLQIHATRRRAFFAGRRQCHRGPSGAQVIAAVLVAANDPRVGDSK